MESPDQITQRKLTRADENGFWEAILTPGDLMMTPAGFNTMVQPIHINRSALVTESHFNHVTCSFICNFSLLIKPISMKKILTLTITTVILLCCGFSPGHAQAPTKGSTGDAKLVASGSATAFLSGAREVERNNPEYLRKMQSSQTPERVGNSANENHAPAYVKGQGNSPAKPTQFAKPADPGLNAEGEFR